MLGALRFLAWVETISVALTNADPHFGFECAERDAMNSGSLPALIRIVGLLTAVILLAIALFHVYWAAGGRWGKHVTVPANGDDPVFRPSTFATLSVALLLGAGAAIVLTRTAFWGESLPRWPFAVGGWALTAVFAARVVGDFRWIGVFKRASDSDFAYWDTRLFVPICTILTSGCLVIALGGK